METLVVFAQHRDQYHIRSHISTHGSFGSPSKDFREINCRSFQSGAGILPTPVKACSSPVTGQSSLNSAKPPSPNPHVVDKQVPYDQNPKRTKRIAKGGSVPIPISIKHVDYPDNENIRGSLDEFFYSELWAGPAYSNSPPPTSLPIPKFSVKPKRTVSLDLPSVSASHVDLSTLIVKSAPTSPTSERLNCSKIDFFNGGDDSATKILRRVLNLDMVDA